MIHLEREWPESGPESEPESKPQLNTGDEVNSGGDVAIHCAIMDMSVVNFKIALGEQLSINRSVADQLYPIPGHSARRCVGFTPVL